MENSTWRESTGVPLLAESELFSFRVVNLWNRLPCDVISTPSVNAFKGSLDNYWVDYCYCYTLDPEDFLRQ